MSIRHEANKTKFYADGITRATDPFWKCTCSKCGHEYLSCIAVSDCPSCGSPDADRFLGDVPFDEIVAERGEPVVKYHSEVFGHFINQSKSE